MATIISKDGTSIAYEKTGNGPGIVLVNGALSHRKLDGEKDLAAALAESYTVIFYDRRGRGESGDTNPYDVDREIEDIEGLINEAGGSAFLYGSSSGAALAFLAGGKLGPDKIRRLALYEPPYVSNSTEDKVRFGEEKKKIARLIAAGKVEDAVVVFLENRGTSPEMLESIRQSPDWKEILRTGRTLPYDFEVLGDGSVPHKVAEGIRIPTLVMNGEESADIMQAAASALTKLIPSAVHKTIIGQAHHVTPEAIAPVLRNFFALTRWQPIIQ